ncbi:MDR family MFS transporter [Furfurilactobacillus siliginis]|uniref:MFS transporter n=1 Tax=Furfurilactobacillus siliginis TaxID=348151 RepID=A0A0R2L8A3_9LACO|nr:MDR family MFS transporter [Furfurilactobacillus siliginis]KRN96053.1 hypothetical protein IV55_GL001736 [Furfurilactobacillus siliginis]GEK28759.1 MFS transporter [Furfurilactobacillus siliginis]
MQTKTNKIPARTLLIAWILVIGALAPMLDSTMVNIALHTLTSNFHSSVATTQWTITGYVLATGIAVPFSGWLVNHFDGKYVYLFGELVFLLGSIFSAVAPNINLLIAARLVQGFGAGLIVPLLTTLLVKTTHGKQIGQLMAIVGLPMLIGPILGPVIGGVILKYASWRWLFWVNVPVAALSAILIITMLPHFPAENKQQRLDWLGTILLAAGSSTVIYGIVQASQKASFQNKTTVLYLAAGIVLFATYVWWAHRQQENAVLPLSLFHFRTFDASMVALLISGMVINGPMLLLPLFFQQVRNMSVINAGLLLGFQGIGMLVARPLIGRLIDNVGAKYVVLGSMLFSFVGTLPFAYFTADTSLVWIAIALVIRGIGVGGVVMPLMTDAYAQVTGSQVSAASIGSRIAQNVGGSLGSAIVATLLSKYLHTHMTHFAHLLKLGHYHVAPTALPQFIHQHSLMIQTHAFQHVFLITTFASLIMILPALFLTDKRKR